MSSTQKRGFRLRWAADSAADEGENAAVSVAAVLEPVADAGAETESTGAARLAPMMTPGTTRDAAPAASPEPETDAEADMMDTETATPQPDHEVAPAEVDAGSAWPTSDRAQASGRGSDEVRAPMPPTQIHPDVRVPRRDNSLVAGLIKAMREAALASRAETTSRLQDEATARVEAIRADATTDAAALRKRVDDDIAGIRDWSKIEMARIRAETEGRIETRRAEAISENKEHFDGVERLVDGVQSTVASFEAEMDQFFEQLLAETDPARLATLAGSAPEPPDLTGAQPTPSDQPATGAADAGTGEREVLEAGAAAEAEAEAIEGLDMTSTGAWPEGARGVRGRGDSANSGAEQHGPGHSRLFVTGLTSVAEISAFKAAVGQLDGVRSVSVSSGERGMFIFNVGHEPEADLAAALASLTGFAVRIMEASGDSLTITARESAA